MTLENILINLLIFSIIHFNAYKFLEKKKNLAKYLKLIILILVIFFALLIFSLNIHPLFFYILLYFIPVFILYNDSLLKKFFYSLFFHITQCLGVYLVLFLLLNLVDIGVLKTSTLIILLFASILSVVILLEFITFKLFKNNEFNNIWDEKKYKIFLFLLLSFLSLVTIISLYIEKYGLIANIYIPRMISLFILFSIILFFTIYFLGILNFYKNNLKEINNNQSFQIKILNDNLKQRKLLNEERAKLIHDVKKHNLLMEAFIIKKEFDELLNYIGDFNKEIDILLNNDFSTNLIIDNILKVFFQKTKEKNIKTEINCNISNNINLNSFDITTLLGNLLENSIEENERLVAKYKFIKLNIWNNDHMFFFSIENPYIKKEKNILNSKKIDKKNHGFGIKNAKKIVKKYNGIINFKNENNSFIVTGYLNLN